MNGQWVRVGCKNYIHLTHFADEKYDYGPSKRMAAYPFLAEHLNLDLGQVQDADGKIDESFVTVEKKGAMLVFGAKNPYPKNAVKPNTALPSNAKD